MDMQDRSHILPELPGILLDISDTIHNCCDGRGVIFSLLINSNLLFFECTENSDCASLSR